jgi:hypothetical protein
MNILVIGNGPSALDRKMGAVIDTFEGIIVRCNRYVIEGYEAYIGKRTNIWIVGKYCKRNVRKKHDLVLVYLANYSKEWLLRLKKNNIQNNEVFVIPLQHIMAVSALLPNESGKWPTTGMMAIGVSMLMGYRVYIYGFDFFTRGFEYFDKNSDFGIECHNPGREKIFIDRLVNEGKVNILQ